MAELSSLARTRGQYALNCSAPCRGQCPHECPHRPSSVALLRLTLNGMHDVLIGVSIVLALVALDILALRFGADMRREPDRWW